MKTKISEKKRQELNQLFFELNQPALDKFYEKMLNAVSNRSSKARPKKEPKSQEQNSFILWRQWNNAIDKLQRDLNCIYIDGDNEVKFLLGVGEDVDLISTYTINYATGEVAKLYGVEGADQSKQRYIWMYLVYDSFLYRTIYFDQVENIVERLRKIERIRNVYLAAKEDEKQISDKSDHLIVDNEGLKEHLPALNGATVAGAAEKEVAHA